MCSVPSVCNVFVYNCNVCLSVSVYWCVCVCLCMLRVCLNVYVVCMCLCVWCICLSVCVCVRASIMQAVRLLSGAECVQLKDCGHSRVITTNPAPSGKKTISGGKNKLSTAQGSRTDINLSNNALLHAVAVVDSTSHRVDISSGLMSLAKQVHARTR